MDRNYGGVVWTNHALERLKQRNIKQGDAWATFRKPDQSRPAQKKGNYVYYRTWEYVNENGQKRYEKIEVVAAKNEKNEWIILSVWSKPDYDRGKSKGKDEKSVWSKLLSALLGK